MATRLTGWVAIEFAEKNGCLLSKKKDLQSPARDDVGIDEARKIAQASPDVIFVDFDELPPMNVA